MKAYTPVDMRNGDSCAVTKLGMTGYELMRNAALAIFEEICRVPLFENGVWGKSFVILCGKGNNGGDGYAVGKLLREDGAEVVCVDVLGCAPGSGEAKEFRKEFIECPGRIVCMAAEAPGECEYISENELSKLIFEADAVVDAVFGTGFEGNITEQSAAGKCILTANAANCIKLSADCPSGVNALTGAVSEVTFRADYTVTLSRAKPGLYGFPAKDFCGRVSVKDIGIPDCAYPKESLFEIADKEYVGKLIKPRPQNSHKGTFGRLLCVCGSKNMTGAAALCVEGALRSGAGLVNAAAQREVLDVLKIKLSEPIFTDIADKEAFEAALLRADAVAIGCGLSCNQEAKELVYGIFESFKKQIIVDADGINALADNINVLEKAAVPPIITPHPLEFSRLSGVSVERILADRTSAAQNFAKQRRCVVVLKGAATVITDGSKVILNTTGNSALAKGGSGDVLCGIIASLAAQGMEALHCAAAGAFVHGLAAQNLSQRYSEFGVLPSDLPPEVGRILGELSEM